MKNIYLIPTDKPSRLIYNDANQLCYQSNKSFKNDRKNRKKFNICITNDEEIKEGDWCYDKVLNIVFQTDNRTNFDYVNQSDNVFKIILTTDQDLIKDGVQAIDDEFLEWFVKNPSCEKVIVEIDYNKFFKKGNITISNCYEIIILKEPKQETLEEAADIERLAMDKLKNKWEHLYTFGYPQRPFPTNYENDLNNIKIGLHEGAKWQAKQLFKDDAIQTLEKGLALLLKKQERMYSEEELKSAFKIGFNIGYGSPVSELDLKQQHCDRWFEQFKKK